MNTSALQSKYPRLADCIAMLAEAIDGLDVVSPAQVQDWLQINQVDAMALLNILTDDKLFTPRYEIFCPDGPLLATASRMNDLSFHVPCPKHTSHDALTCRFNLLF